MLQRDGSRVVQRTATEHSPTTRSVLDPAIVLQKCKTPPAVHIKTHHNRTPDVGIGILIFIPSNRYTPDASDKTQYYGEYLGHGQSKTAFELICTAAEFHGKVLKVATVNDMEPSVFTHIAQDDLTTSILYNCEGTDADSECRFHCWITDRTIPLDEFCRFHDAIMSRCSLAAFYCMLRAARLGLYLSDCHFFNFGVQLSGNATEHRVVIIDAGSRGIQTGAS